MYDIRVLKEKLINDYISSNLNLKFATTKDIKMGLRHILDEEPAVKFVYKENMKINETTGKVERLPNELESIEIYYTYLDSNNIPHASHMKYIIS